jgi:uncharacterized protein YukJ
VAEKLIVMSIPDTSKKMIAYATLMAIKEPKTKNWTFVDYGNLNDDQVKILLPEFVGKVNFPRSNIKPMLLPKEEIDSNIEVLMDIIDESLKKAKLVDTK